MAPAIAEIRDRLQPLLVQHGVRRAAVFGSRARGDDRPDSDLDLIVEFNDDRSLLDLVGLRQDIQEVLGINADVVTYNSIRKEFRPKVLQEQVSIL